MIPLKQAESRAEELGHQIEWELVGEHLAHGECVKCGAPIHVTSSPHDGSGLEGEALAVACPVARNA